MMFHRPRGLRPVVLCVGLVSFGLSLQGAPQAQQQPPPQPQPAQQPPPQQQPKKPTPFENLPQTPAEAPKPPQQPPIQTVTPAKPEAPGTAQSGAPPENIIENFEFRGARRVRQDPLSALIFSKKGVRYDEEALHLDFMALWNTGRFDDIHIERDAVKAGSMVRVVVVE